MQVSRYEGDAQSFLDDHPVGTVVSAGTLLKWVEQKPGNGALKADLGHDDPAKRITAVRKHINDGARSENLPQDQRFQLEIEDTKNRTFIVRSHATVVKDVATAAIGKSINGALKPLQHGQRMIASVKLDELPDIERTVLEQASANMAAIEAVVKPTFAQEVDRIWIAEMARRGISADVALKVRAALPDLNRVQKLLRAVS